MRCVTAGLKTLIALSLVLGSSALAGAPRVLVTAFDPFAGAPYNASQEMVQAFRDSLAQLPLAVPAEVQVEILPVVYGEAEERLFQLIASFQPDAVVSFGQAGPGGFLLEQVARNWDGGYPDNLGKSRTGEIVKGGPKTLKTSLPVTPIFQAFRKAGIPVGMSTDAGDFLCNHLFYQLMTVAPRSNLKRAGFIHVPDFGPGYASNPRGWGVKYAPAIRHAVTETLIGL